MVIKGREQNVNLSASRSVVMEEKESHTRNVALERQRKKRLEERKEKKLEKKLEFRQEIEEPQTERKTKLKTKAKRTAKRVVKSRVKRTTQAVAKKVEQHVEDSADFDGKKLSNDESEYAGRFVKKQQDRLRDMAVKAVMLLFKELMQLAGAVVAAMSNVFVLTALCILGLVVVVSGTVGNLTIIQDTDFLSGGRFPDAVMQWADMVDEAIERNNDPECGIDLKLFKSCILATIQQESGGLTDAPGVNGDIMQCAESGYMATCPVDWPIEKKSIDAGVRVFYDALKMWGVSDPNDIDGLQMVAQGYNYGPGFFTWARDNGYDTWSLEMSKEFSMMMGNGTPSYGTYTYGSSWLQKLYAGGGVFNSDLIGDGEYIWAVDSQFNQSGSFFGKRVPTLAGASTWHKGIDFGVGEGCNVYAITDGVISAKYYDDGTGNCIEITTQTEDGTLVHRYMHNSAFADVEVGQEVSMGQLIAYAGSTGISRGTHCHLETILNGVHVNPYIYCYGGNTNILARDKDGNLTRIDIDCTPGSWSADAGTQWNTYYSYCNGHVVLGTGEEQDLR